MADTGRHVIWKENTRVPSNPTIEIQSYTTIVEGRVAKNTEIKEQSQFTKFSKTELN